ncbi:uncharacterized protein [Triticum aestivum]|uniref:uncharacterized protein isoform X3 n=1 Tax=Triticum aestivum TaxID=4565 RepID=UPI001D02A9F8|nr:uncharacterized protein LOC123121785 isoform X3 [Triticum aestivum]
MGRGLELLSIGSVNLQGGLLDHSPSVLSICKVICSIPRCWFCQTARFFVQLDCRLAPVLDQFFCKESFSAQHIAVIAASFILKPRRPSHYAR